MKGLDWMHALVAGTAPRPPIVELLDIRFVEAGPGHSVLAMQVRGELFNAMGTLHGGVLCDLADVAMGAAAVSTLDDGASFTTLELKANYFKPVRDGELTATARVVRTTRQLIYVECEITDVGDSLVAKVASTCMVRRP